MRIIVNDINEDDFDKICPVIEDLAQATYKQCAYRFNDGIVIFAKKTKSGISLFKDGAQNQRGDK